MATLDELVGKLRTDERYNESAELLASFRDIDPEKLVYLERVVSVFRRIQRYVLYEYKRSYPNIFGTPTPISELSKERLNDYLKQWLRTIKSLKITLLSEGILNYELERTDDEEYTESGIITPELTEAIIGREENEFYVKVVRKVMDNVKKEREKYVRKIWLDEKKKMVVLDENDKKLIPYENILSLLTEIKGYPTFGETEFNLVAPLFDDLGDIQNKGYLLHLIGRLYSPELKEYASRVIQSKASTLAKCFMLQQPVPQSLVDISTNDERFNQFVDEFGRYVGFVERLIKNKMELRHDPNVISSEQPLGFLFGLEDVYNFLNGLCVNLATNYETELDSTYYQLIKILIQKSNESKKENTKNDIEEATYKAFKRLVLLGRKFESELKLDEIIALAHGDYDKGIAEAYDKETEKAARSIDFPYKFKKLRKNRKEKYTQSVIERAFRIIKDGRCTTIEEVIECASIDIPNYKIIRKVASGGFKRVYKAVYHKEGFDPIVVALKIVDRVGTTDSSNVDELTRRFGLDGLTRGEVTNMQWLDHPNIAKLVDYGKTKEGEFYLAERFIRGLTLRKLFQSRDIILGQLKYESEQAKNPESHCSRSTYDYNEVLLDSVEEIMCNMPNNELLEVKNTREIVTIEDGKLENRTQEEITNPKERLIGFYLTLCKDVVSIMESLLNDHNRTHLDIKPENIIIENHGQTYITDMQTSRGLVPTHEKSDGVHGSKNYACPTLLNGEVPEYECDIYSIGIMIYEAITGHLPFGPYKSREEAKEDHNNNHNAKLEEALGLVGVNIDKESNNIEEGSDNTDRKVLSKENLNYLKGILRKCLAYSIKDRYRDISQLRHDLEKVLDNMFHEKRVVVEGEEISPEDIRIINFLKTKYSAATLEKVVKSTGHIEVDEDYDFVVENE